MDKKIANNLVLGVFVMLGLAAFCFFVFTIEGGTGLLSSTVTFYGRWTHVKGLHAGSEVSLAGLRIGVISAIEVSAGTDRTLIVKMEVDRSAQKHIRQDSDAVIRTQGILGDKYIEISIGNAELPVIEHGKYISTREEVGLLTKGGSLVEGISKQFAEGGKIDTLLVHLNVLVENLSDISKDIRSNRGVLHELIYGKSGDDLGKTLKHLKGIMRKLDKGKGTLGAFINDPTVYEDIKYLLGGAKRSTVLKYFIRQFVEEGEEKPTSKK